MFLLRITQAFQQANIPYALVGGYAVALHGAVRGTIDVDIIISLDKTHFEQTEKLVLDLGLQPKLPIHAAELFEHREQYIQERNLIAWSFVNPDKPSECLDIIITEDLKHKHIEDKILHNQCIQVLSIDDLIAMKKVSGRVQDLEDIKALQALNA